MLQTSTNVPKDFVIWSQQIAKTMRDRGSVIASPDSQFLLFPNAKVISIKKNYKRNFGALGTAATGSYVTTIR